MPPHLIDLVPKQPIDIVPILRAYPGEFHHLNVVAWLANPKMRDQLEEVLSHHVTACGYTEDSILNAHGLVQLGLLGTELFQFDGAFAPGAVQILDVRTPPHPRTCTDRPKLLDTLATLLLEYDRNCTYEERGKPHLRQDQTQKALAYLQQTLGAFLHVRAKQRRATHPTRKHLSRKKIENASETMAKAVKALTLEDYQLIDQHELKVTEMLRSYTEYNPLTETLFSPATFERDWLLALYDAFKQYGPSRNYPQDAIFHALAAIYLQFALAEGDRPKVAERLQKRWQRQKADAAKREEEEAATAAAGLLRRQQRREAEAPKFAAERAAWEAESLRRLQQRREEDAAMREAERVGRSIE